MKLKILILYCIIFIYFDFIYSQDISADDLKLLESFEFERLRDFIRKGTVSKVPFLSNDEDFFEEERKAQATVNPSNFDLNFQNEEDEQQQQPQRKTTLNPSDFDFNFEGDIQIGGMMQDGENQMPQKFELMKPTKKLMPGESLIIPNFITPPPTIASTPKPKRRKQNRRPTTTTPESITTTTIGPTNEDFEELAKILQKFRKSQITLSPLSMTPPLITITTPEPIPSTRSTTLRPRFPFRHQQQGFPTIVEQTIPDFQEFVVSPLSEKWKGLASPLPPQPSNENIHYHHKSKNLFGGINIRPSKFTTSTLAPQTNSQLPTLIPMDESDILFPQNPANGEQQQLVAITQEEWENKMREISRKLGNYLMSVKKKKEQEGLLSKGSYQVNGVQQELRPAALNFSQGKTSSAATSTSRAMIQRTIPKAYVTLLREGFMHQTNSNQFTFVASISLIRDNEKVILVDTGLATDINGRTDLIQKLSKLNIAPPMVDYVVITHGHPDHAGNTNDFPDSIHYQGNFIHHRTKFNISKLAHSNSINLTPNVQLLKTPGHTAEDISVIISNTDKYGTIAISGDIFMSDKDIDYPMMWKKFSYNESQQEHSRRELICIANYIVPGHGKIFKVTSEMKNGVNCESRGSNSNNNLRRRNQNHGIMAAARKRYQ